MLINIFKSNNPWFLILLPILVLLIWIYIFFQPTYINQENSGILFNLIIYLVGWNKYLSVFFSVIMVIIELFLIYKISVKYALLPTDTFLPALFYLILLHSFPACISLNPIIIVNLFLLLSLNSIFSFYGQEENLEKIFNAGLFISLASLLCPSTTILFLIIWGGLLFLRPFVWREWLIALIGFALPYLFLFAYYYLFEIKFEFFLTNLSRLNEASPDLKKFSFTNINYSDTIIFFVVILVFFASLLQLLKKLSRQNIKIRRFYGIILYLIVLLIICGFIIPTLTSYYFAIFSIPLAIIFSRFFLNIKKHWEAEVLFLVLLGTIILGYL